ncbi:MAG: hypothetical protein K6T86_11000 [Pirellulales bacterium]|nr:hypothetical protein [Pirellulales bacterium]
MGIVLIYLGRASSTGETIASILVPLLLAGIIGWANLSAARSIEQDRDTWFPPQ